MIVVIKNNIIRTIDNRHLKVFDSWHRFIIYTGICASNE